MTECMVFHLFAHHTYRNTRLCTVDGLAVVQGTVSAAQSLFHGDD